MTNGRKKSKKAVFAEIVAPLPGYGSSSIEVKDISLQQFFCLTPILSGIV